MKFNNTVGQILLELHTHTDIYQAAGEVIILLQISMPLLNSINQATKDVDISNHPPIRLLTSFLEEVVPLCKNATIGNTTWLARLSHSIGEHIARGVCLAEMNRKHEGKYPNGQLR